MIAQRLSLLALLACSACSAGPQINDQSTVYTPIFADNRVYHLSRESDADGTKGLQHLESLGNPVESGDKDVVLPNEPLSIVVRSVEIPYAEQGSPIDDAADYVVILDVGTAADGSNQSLVVWYQRGVHAGQSLNFSNLLVYYEPRWDERVAPYFRVRVMDVTKERNEETRRTLERAQGIATTAATLAATPEAMPLIGIAFTAAELVLANKSNRMVVDYSVQLYSSSAQAKAGSGQLGALKKGSYIVVGRPNKESRQFWTQDYWFEPEGRSLLASNQPVNVPVALLTVGTFESIVPKLVLERSVALTRLLTEEPGKSNIEEIGELTSRLEVSVRSFVYGEQLTRYRDATTISEMLKYTEREGVIDLLSAEDQFFLTRSISNCLRPDQPFADLAEAKAYFKEHSGDKCKRPQ